MIALLFVVLQSAPVQYGEALLRQYGTYSMQSCKVRVEPILLGARIQCDIRLKVRSPGPLHFVLTKDVLSLRVLMSGQRLPHKLEGGALGTVVSLVAPEAQGVPTIVVVRPTPAPRAGDELTLRFEYLWRPGRGGMAYAGGGRIESHLTSFWLPTMAHQRFTGRIDVVTRGRAIAAGKMSAIYHACKKRIT